MKLAIRLMLGLRNDPRVYETCKDGKWYSGRRTTIVQADVSQQTWVMSSKAVMQHFTYSDRFFPKRMNDDKLDHPPTVLWIPWGKRLIKPVQSFAPVLLLHLLQENTSPGWRWNPSSVSQADSASPLSCLHHHPPRETSRISRLRARRGSPQT